MCTDGEDDAERAIRFGGSFARGLDANVTVLHVLPEWSEEEYGALTASRRSLSEWKTAVPAIEYLDRAGNILEELGLVRPRATQNHYVFREQPDGGLEFHLVGKRTKRVRLKFRNGEPQDEIIEEAGAGRYDLVITGARSQQGMPAQFVGATSRRVAEFSPCSVLIAKNIRDQHRFMICTDGSKQSERAELFGATIAQSLSAEVTVLSIAEEEELREEAHERVRRAEMVLSQLGIKAQVKTRVGLPSEEILEEAMDQDLVVMGASGSSAVRRFFLGSVPLKVIEDGQCPVLLVRDKTE